MHSAHFNIDGIAWDWVNEKLYWTDRCRDEIAVYDPATQKRRVLTTTGTNPFAIVVDPGHGYTSQYLSNVS